MYQVPACEPATKRRVLASGTESTGSQKMTVGQDLSPFYPHNLALDLSSPPGNGVFRELLGMLAQHLRYGSHRLIQVANSRG